MSASRRRVAGWIALALAGLALAVAVGYAATQLVSQHVALSSEPRLGDDRLVAPRATHPAHRDGERASAAPHETRETDDD